VLLGTIVFLAVFFGIKYFQKKEITEKLENELTEFQADSKLKINIPDSATLYDVYLHLLAKGFTQQNIMNFLSANDTVTFNKYITEYLTGNKALADSFIDSYVGEIEIDTDEETPPAPKPEPVDTSPAYTKLYPDLYAAPPTEFFSAKDTAYLTFDDGPSSHTPDILSTLDEYGIKATFFFSGGTTEEDKRIMKSAADSGHTIGIHSISHDYTLIYATVESYLEDFYNTYTIVYEATGVRAKIFRFPGGSLNNYNRLIYQQIIAEMTRRGFVYYDWNVAGDDASNGATWTSVYNNVLAGAREHIGGRAIVLLHDSKYTTATVIEDVIDALINMGFTFKPLDETVLPVTFSYTDVR
jgi:peptidoglycan/xylan/chitin deacetylase (PgdA/CDA1 family)